jgi:hypothetical protein
MGSPDGLAMRGHSADEQNIAARMAEAYDAARRGDYPAALAIRGALSPLLLRKAVHVVIASTP